MQSVGDLADGGLGGAAARAVGGVAVHPVLGDVDVEGAESVAKKLFTSVKILRKS